MKGRLAHRGDCARVVNIGAKVAAGIDAGDDEIHIGRETIESNAHAIGGCAFDGPEFRFALFNAHGPLPGGDGVTASGEVPVRRNNDMIVRNNALEREEARRADAVVVGE